jgi:hypothetical protein
VAGNASDWAEGRGPHQIEVPAKDVDMLRALIRGFTLGLVGEDEVADQVPPAEYVRWLRRLLIERGLLSGGPDGPGPLDRWREDFFAFARRVIEIPQVEILSVTAAGEPLGAMVAEQEEHAHFIKIAGPAMLMPLRQLLQSALIEHFPRPPREQS